MNLYNKHIEILQGLEPVFDFNPAEVKQGSLEWRILRLGCLSASNADKIVAKRDSEGRQSYMASLIDQVISCEVDDSPSFKQTEFGKLYEPAARDALSVALGFVEIKELPFMYMDESMRAGVSPDGLFDNTIVELKVPYDGANFAKFAAFDGMKKSWRWQCQFQLWATGASRHIMAQYNPRIKLCDNLYYGETLQSDDDFKTLSDAVPQFIADMDKALASLGVKFGQHWEYLKDNL